MGPGFQEQGDLLEDAPLMRRLAHHIISLDINWISEPSDDFIKSIATLSRLTLLRLQADFSEFDAGPLVALKQLIDLTLQLGSVMQGIEMGHFASMQQLKLVSLTIWDDNPLEPFSGAPSLQCIDLHPSEALYLPPSLALVGLTKLVLGEGGTQLTGEAACFTSLKSLQVLHMSDVWIDDDSITGHSLSTAIGGIASLTELILQGVRDAGDQGCLDSSLFLKLTRLRHLSVQHCGLSDRVSIPHACSHLTCLDLAKNFLTCLPDIPASAALTKLVLSHQLDDFQIDRPLCTLLDKATGLEQLHLQQHQHHTWSLGSLMHLSTHVGPKRRSQTPVHDIQIIYQEDVPTL